MKIATIIGARPQFIKAATVSRAFKKSGQVDEFIVHTGQHFDEKMSDVFFEELGIPTPRYNLGINSLNHGAMTGRMLEELEKIFLAEKPDLVLVYGDTNSTLAGALAAKKLQIKVAHVEAGLRSFNMRMPEEINRILTDQISDLLFCPTQTAIDNLNAEGFEKKPCKIFLTGDVMYDSALFYSRKIENSATEPFALCTIHREENTDNEGNFRSIIGGLVQISQKIKILIPMHPRTIKTLAKYNMNLEGSNIQIIEPVAYTEMIKLLSQCSIVLTDSGGLQKEAYFMEKPCITLRNETEWVELVQSGTNILCGVDGTRIENAYNTLTTQKNDFSKKLYGNGHSSELVAETVLKNLKK